MGNMHFGGMQMASQGQQEIRITCHLVIPITGIYNWLYMYNLFPAHLFVMISLATYQIHRLLEKLIIETGTLERVQKLTLSLS